MVYKARNKRLKVTLIRTGNNNHLSHPAQEPEEREGKIRTKKGRGRDRGGEAKGAEATEVRWCI